jgi:hypothetical protein
MPPNPTGWAWFARAAAHAGQEFHGSTVGRGLDYFQSGDADQHGVDILRDVVEEAQAKGRKTALTYPISDPRSAFNGLPIDYLEHMADGLEADAAASRAVFEPEKAKREAEYEAMPPAKGFVEDSAVVGGRIVGAAAEPLNWIAGPELRVVRAAGESLASYLARKAAAKLVPQMGVAAGANIVDQFSRGQGFQPVEVGLAALTAGAIGGTLHTSGALLKEFRNWIAARRGVQPDRVTIVSPEEIQAAKQDPDLQEKLSAADAAPDATGETATGEQATARDAAGEAAGAPPSDTTPAPEDNAAGAGSSWVSRVPSAEEVRAVFRAPDRAQAEALIEKLRSIVKLPKYDGPPTSAVLLTSDGRVIELKSGTADPAYRNYPAARHAEGKAALLMRQDGLPYGIVFHNHPYGTCGGCNSNLPTLLPEGAKLWTVPLADAKAKDPTWIDHPEPYTGNSAQPLPPKPAE